MERNVGEIDFIRSEANLLFPEMKVTTLNRKQTIGSKIILSLFNMSHRDAFRTFCSGEVAESVPF